MCSPTSTISTLAAPDAEYTHLLADDIHLSTAGQIIEADYEYSLITAPTEISLLAEAPVKTRQTMIEAMFTQIGLGQPIWADIIGSAGLINDQVNRIVPIGIAQLSNTGSTSSNLSLAAEGGYNFRSGPVTHGPLAGMLLQHIYIDGYTETDPFAAVGGFTALSYANQIRNSAVSELGYQASAQIGNWSPFAKLTWDHEFGGANRTVTASLTTIAAPSYYMPALVFGTDWMTLSAGTSFRLERGIIGYAMFTGGLAQNDVTSYGAQVGVNVALNEWIAPKAF